jgi:hypothetical protein
MHFLTLNGTGLAIDTSLHTLVEFFPPSGGEFRHVIQAHKKLLREIGTLRKWQRQRLLE